MTNKIIADTNVLVGLYDEKDALIITFAFSQNISFIASFDTNFDGITGITRLFDPIAPFK